MSYIEDMYWESFDDQTAEDFTHVGIAGQEPELIVDLEAQVAELRRLHGAKADILVYREVDAEHDVDK